SPLNFGSTGNNARRGTGILTGLFLVRERIFPTVIYTGQAFLAPEKLVRSVWSENPIIGTNVDPAGSDFYRATKPTVSTRNTSNTKLLRTHFVPECPTTSPLCASQSTIVPHLNCIHKQVRKPYQVYMRPGGLGSGRS